jgi:predicted DCC family thiol-disulfide oxidoreductase YuxK
MMGEFMGSQAVSINEPDPAPAGWILYDDSCGVCRTLIPFGKKALRKRGFGVAPLQSDWVAGRLNLRAEDLKEDLRLLLPGGRSIQGADVYRYAMRRIWWAYPMYLFSVTPLLGSVFNRAYRLFADHRHHVSRICRLPGAA